MGTSPLSGRDTSSSQLEQRLLPGVKLSPILDPSMVNALQGQQTNQERTREEQTIYQDTDREGQRRTWSGKRREFFDSR